MNTQKIKKYAFLTISAIPAILLNFAPIILAAVIFVTVAYNNPPTETQLLAEYIATVMDQTIALSAITMLAITVYLLSNLKVLALLAFTYVACCAPIAWMMHRVMEENPQS